jgi:hypothetical protein
MEIIGGVIHGHRVPLLNTIASNEHFVVVVLRKGWRFLVVLTAKDPSKEVVLKVRNEVLGWVSQPRSDGKQQKDLPSKRDHSHAPQGPIGKGPGYHIPSLVLSSVDLVTCFHLLALIGFDPTASHPFVP